MDKLVRDKIVEIISEEGRNCEYHVAVGDEYERRLKDKLVEEINEFFEDPCVMEMADILEVLEAMKKFYKLDPYIVSIEQSNKRWEKGGFYDGIVLDKLE